MNKKVLIAILSAVILLIAGAMFIYYDATFLARYDYKVSYLTLDNPDSRKDDLRILYLTDLEYGTYTDETNLRKITARVSQLDYDLIIFGGDLFDIDYTPGSEDISVLTSFFREMKADDGKFAIFGDYDLISESRKNITNKILTDSGFEMIDEKVKIYLTSSRYFTIYGYDYGRQVERQPDSGEFFLAVIHDLSLCDQLSSAQLILCGNSHAGQLNWPLSSGYRPGYHSAQNLYYSSGLGMTKTPHRLFSDPEIVIITLN
ncbi:MAG: metallophosphoesterase [Erysipelotrichaceae bacterium]|nr:metallophosphoesterase [Erysipelotrichaceae bacterium]